VKEMLVGLAVRYCSHWCGITEFYLPSTCLIHKWN